MFNLERGYVGLFLLILVVVFIAILMISQLENFGFLKEDNRQVTGTSTGISALDHLTPIENAQKMRADMEARDRGLVE